MADRNERQKYHHTLYFDHRTIYCAHLCSKDHCKYLFTRQRNMDGWMTVYDVSAKTQYKCWLKPEVFF